MAGVLFALVAARAEATPGAILDGVYRGLGPAEGVEIAISTDPDGFTGVFTDTEGLEQRFLADRVGDIADAVLDMDGRVVLMQMVPRPWGAEVALLPLDGEGRIDREAGRLLEFLGPGIAKKSAPPGYTPPPPPEGAPIAANSFLASYPYWRPAAVATGYLGLPPRHRTLIALFPAVQLDVLWRLCLAPAADRALAIALRSADLGCEPVRGGMARTQAEGTYREFRREVAGDLADLRRSVRCADNYVMPEGECDAAARRIAEAAASLESPASVLGRYN